MIQLLSHLLCPRPVQALRSVLLPVTCIQCTQQRRQHWSNRVAAPYNNVMKTKDKQDLTSSLYVHWPYCARRCTYCNFNKYISNNVDHERMKQCLVTELQFLLKASVVQEVTSVFFGGGTPSLARPSTIQAVLDTLRKNVRVSSNAEITLEVNPTKMEMKKLKDFKMAGINRISLGIQALDESDLKLLGREHSVLEALRCLEEAKTLYPGSVSIDVIFGRPNQTLDGWNKELEEILIIADSHVSLYQLTVERGTQLFKWIQNNTMTVPSDDEMSDLYLCAVERLAKAGLPRYEISNFSKPGCESVHNMGYWMGQQYIGIGPGAHGRFRVKGEKEREWHVQTLEPEFWMREIEQNGHATRKRQPLSSKIRIQELLITGLRMTSGITYEVWNCIAHETLQTVFGNETKVENLLEENLIELNDRGIRATSKGLPVVDSIITILLEVLNQKIKE